MFLPQNDVLLSTESPYPTLSLSLTDTHIVCTHLNISTNVVSTTQ